MTRQTRHNDVHDLYDDLEDAYLKFKSFVYHENFSVCLKQDLSAFEMNYKRRMNKLTSEVKQLIEGKESTFLERKLQRISYHLMPKKIESPEYDAQSGLFYTNQNLFDKYQITDLKNIMPFIDCAIELHILSTYWTIRIGPFYEKKVSRYCFANRLYDLKHYRKIDRLRLFKRYYSNYNKWRDTAIKTAKNLHEKGNNVAILNLDIKSYYHSMDLDLNSFRVSGNLKWLNQMLVQIHSNYLEKLINDKILETPAKRIIPIGLISSNILANFYLKDLDSLITSKMRPAFYGRYVDDILFVFTNPIIDERKKNVVYDFIMDNLVSISPQKGLAYISKGTDDNFTIVIRKNKLHFQLSKVRLYYFKNSDNVSLLEEFEKEIKRNSSEFRLQIEEEELKNPFEDSVYQINYSDTINKLRSIEGFTTNKFGASKQLSKIIAVTKYLNENNTAEIEKISEKMNNYFQGKQALELNILWERSFTYFIVNKDSKGLVRFARQLIEAISNITIEVVSLRPAENKLLTNRIYDGLLGHLINSFSAAAALDINFINTAVLNPIKEPTKDAAINTILKAVKMIELTKTAQAIVAANLFNHAILAFPLINYAKQTAKFSFVSKELSKRANFDLDRNKIKLSPRYINFHEVEIFNFMKYRMTSTEIPEGYNQEILSFNQGTHATVNNLKKPQRGNFFKNLRIIQKTNYRVINADPYKKFPVLRVGLANMKLDENDILGALDSRSNLSLDRLNRLNRILNSCIEYNVQMVILPEVSIPFAWLNKLSEFSKRNNIAVVCGLEHFVHRRQASNYVCTILPFRDGYYFNAHVDLRLKIDYSPHEMEEITSRGLSKPGYTDTMRLYYWRNFVFSVFNCFELTDIEKRTIFRGLVDVIFAVEYNKDINYFSNINESYSRDIHAYMIQVNSSDYGDSRVTLPASTVKRDYIKMKGGENVSLIVGDIDIKKLRDFQKLPLTAQNDKARNHLFKPVPPNYKMSLIRRIT